jgi:hypothetical protein
MANIYSKMGGPVGANLIVNPRRLSDGLGVNAVDMRRGSGDFRPLRLPVPVVADAPAISSLLVGSTVVEGNPLTYTATLARPTILAAIYSISWGGGTASSADYVAPPTFTNGVTLISGNTQIVVPAGVSSFVITFATVDDSDIESTEYLPLTIGGVSATGSILDNDTTGYYCPLSNYRELDPAGTAGYTYTSNFSSTPPPTGRSDDIFFTGSWDLPGPTEYGLCWKLGSFPSPGPAGPNDLYIEVTNPTTTMANTIYFELLGEVTVEIDTNLTNNAATATYPIPLSPYWTYRSLNLADSLIPGYIKRVRIKRVSTTSFGLAFVANIKLLCSQPPAYCPLNSSVAMDPYNPTTGTTVVPPDTLGYTDSIIDNTGTSQPAIYYPETQHGASTYGWTWVIGNPLDTTKTLTVTIDDPTATKVDTASFEADGYVRIEVWDSLTSLAGSPTYTFNYVYPVPAAYDYWWHYTSYPLVHPPIGSHGNIKRVRLTALDPAGGSTPKPTNIFRLQFSCSNLTAQRTDVGQMNP